MFRVALARLVAASFATIIISSFAIPASALEVHLFRGLGDFSFIARGLTFSDGMDKLADKLSASGIRAASYRWDEADGVYRDLMRRKPAAVALVGHSMGAVASLGLASRLAGSGIRVVYLGTIDIPGPASMVPRNVEWAENYYHAFPVFGHLNKPAGFKGIVTNEFVLGEMHVTMDNSRRVHDAMISAVWLADAVGRTGTLRAYAPEAGSARSEDLTARVEKVLNASAAADASNDANGDGVIAAKMDIDDQAVVAGAAASGQDETAAQEIDAAPKKYWTKSGLPPIE